MIFLESTVAPRCVGHAVDAAVAVVVSFFSGPGVEGDDSVAVVVVVVVGVALRRYFTIFPSVRADEVVVEDWNAWQNCGVTTDDDDDDDEKSTITATAAVAAVLTTTLRVE